MSHGEVCRCGSNPALLWLWHRPGAVAPMRPLAWEPPYATGVALKRPNTHTHTHKNKKTKKKEKRIGRMRGHILRRQLMGLASLNIAGQPGWLEILQELMISS